jgi:hypothetical protein
MRRSDRTAKDRPGAGRPVTPAAPAELAGVHGVHVVHPTAVYRREAFRAAFGLRDSSLRREVREGRLKVYKRCGKYYILGEDVLAWLRGGVVRPRTRTGAANGEGRDPT